MKLETHLTVAVPAQTLDALTAWLGARAMELTTIELAHGASPHQPMITTWNHGSIEDAVRAADALGVELAALGVAVTRVKIETAHDGSSPPARYLEHHVKVRLATAERAALAELARTHQAHLSRSARRRIDDAEERFLTQRFAADADEAAARALDRLLEALRAAAFTVVKVVRERVVYDSNQHLDEGWAPEISS